MTYEDEITEKERWFERICQAYFLERKRTGKRQPVSLITLGRNYFDFSSSEVGRIRHRAYGKLYDPSSAKMFTSDDMKEQLANESKKAA